MDKWTTAYLQSWQSEFSTEPDAESCLRFLESILSELQRLSQADVHDQVSTSMIATITSLPDPDQGLEYVQDVLFDAATSSPLEPSSLATLTRQLIDNLPAPSNEKLEKGIASNTRERWNGPDKPALGEEITESIEKWVSLNRFVAHLTRLHVSLRDYGVWSLDRAFNPQAGGYRADERAYHVPAAAAWMEVLGAEIYRWSGGDQWEQWKRVFEVVSQSSDSFPADAREHAQRAFKRMREVESGA